MGVPLHLASTLLSFPLMERRSDAPFFVERTQEQQRPQFHIVSRNDEFPDPAIEVPKRRLNEFQEQGVRIIRDFLTEMGLMDPSLDEENYDATFLKKDFAAYHARVIEDNGDVRHKIHRGFISFMSLKTVMDYCHAQLSGTIEVVKTLPENPDFKKLTKKQKRLIFNSAFLEASHWRKVDSILHKSFTVPAEKLLRFEVKKTDLNSLLNKLYT